MAYTLICVGTVNIPKKPKGLTTVYTGDVLNVPQEEGDKLLRYFPGSFRVHRQYDEAPESEPTEPVNLPSQPTPETKLIAELQADSNKLVESDVESIVLPLDDDAHHSTVKAYVLDLEEENPIDLAKVKAVKAKFPNYASVVAECNRILSVNNALDE